MNMLKKMIAFPGAALLLLLSYSCEFSFLNDTDPDDTPVPSVTGTVAWRIATNAESNQHMLEKEGVIYFSEIFNDGAVAVDAATGTIVWRDSGRYELLSRPIFFSNGLIGYLPEYTERPGLYLYNDDGTYYDTIYFPDNGYIERDFAAWSDGTMLFKPAVSHGIVGFDIIDDVFEEEGETHVIPEVYYPKPPDEDGDGDIYYFIPTTHNGVLYGGANPSWGEAGIFFAVDISSRNIIWESSSTGLRGWSDWNLEYRDGRLIVLDAFGFGIINAATGDFIVDRPGREAGGKMSGGHFYNNKVYVSNGWSPTEEDNTSNVFCLSLETGQTVWSQPFPYSHGSNPVCHEGITYVFSQEAMRLVNAETGEYLAIDKDINGDPWQICNVIKYEDTAIFRNNKNELVCVRLDFRLYEDGKLWQEK